MTRLYHYTSRRQLPAILSSGELLMTPNPYTPKEIGVQPVLWLTNQDGVAYYGDTLAHGLGLSGSTLGVQVDRLEVQFVVEVPDDEVVSWEDYCDYYDVSSVMRRRAAKWPSKSEWWVPFLRSVPSSEWVMVGVGRDKWTPMFAPDPDAPVETEAVDA
jgi:hypothetical protein